MQETNLNAGHRQRLKERFLTHGAETFAPYELLELLLMQAIPRKDVKPIAKDLLSRFKTVAGVLKAEIHDLKAVEGIGENTAFFLKLMDGTCVRYHKSDIQADPKVENRLQLLAYLYAKLSELKHEECHALYLNAKHRIIGDECLFKGTVSESAVYPREVVKAALRHGATAIVLVHNHPSGDPSPSPQDDILTANMYAAARALNIELYDHIIIGNRHHYSFKDHGKL